MAPAPLVPESGRRDGSSSSGSDEASGAEARRAPGGLADDGFLEATADTDAGSGWSITESAGFERGIVEAQATCGDPFADGFVYDDQIVEVDAATAEPPTSGACDDAPCRPGCDEPGPDDPWGGRSDASGAGERSGRSSDVHGLTGTDTACVARPTPAERSAGRSGQAPR